MFARRLKRYTGLILVIGLLTILLLAVVSVNVYCRSACFEVTSANQAHNQSLQSLLTRTGPKDARITKQIRKQLHLIRRGGEFVSPAGVRHSVKKASDLAVISSINRIESLYASRQFDEVPLAFDAFITAYQQYADELKEQLHIVLLIAAGIGILLFAMAWRILSRLGNEDVLRAKRRQEISKILSAVKDGLFLIDAEFQIGSVQSAAVSSLFGQRDKIKGDFFELIQPLVSVDDMADAEDYISLLMDGRGKASLLKDLNPLNELELNLLGPGDKAEKRYLSFDFLRNSRKDVAEILVSVRDVTKEVELKRALDLANEGKEERFHLLMSSLTAEPADLAEFYSSTFESLEQINSLLKDEEKSHGDNTQKLNAIFQKVHKVKGNASAIGMTLVETSAHFLENKIDELKANPAVDGKQILGLTVQLKQMISELEFLQQLTTKVDLEQRAGVTQSVISSGKEKPQLGSYTEEVPKLQQFAKEVATRHDKSVNLDLYGLEKYPLIEAASREVEAFCIQLIRNAVVHGIEDKETRSELNKPSAGQIVVSMKEHDDKRLMLTVRDDGAGLNMKQIRAKAITRNMVSFDDAAGLNASQIVRFLFKPGFSTADSSDIDAGRGYGLDIVKSTVENLGGRIGVRSRKGRFCEFNITLPRTLIAG